MEESFAPRFAVLGHPERLAIFRLLLRRHPSRVSAGEIAVARGLKASTLSSYLGALMQAGLVTQMRAGTSLQYSVDLTAIRATLDFLVLDCCLGRPDLFPAGPLNVLEGCPRMPDTPYNVLFICTGNSARSIFAEALLRDEGGGRFAAHSAGTKPYSELNPFALEVLHDKGHDTAPLRAKNIAEFQGPEAPKLDFVFTVCDRAANEECPAWDGQPISAHWGMPDPVKAGGTVAEQSLAFQHAYGALRNRIRAFAALPFETLDRIGLQRAVDDIARDTAPA
ncbi:MAG: ArsR family transcriptional regulator [Pseudomonadota bacterium]